MKFHWLCRRSITWVDPGFQVRGRGGTLKKLRRAEGGAKIVGVFRVKNHDFTPCRTNIIMSTYEYKYNSEVSHQSP